MQTKEGRGTLGLEGYQILILLLELGCSGDLTHLKFYGPIG